MTPLSFLAAAVLAGVAWLYGVPPNGQAAAGLIGIALILILAES